MSNEILNKWNVRQLRKFIKEYNLHYKIVRYTLMKKVDLIEAINKHIKLGHVSVGNVKTFASQVVPLPDKPPVVPPRKKKPKAPAGPMNRLPKKGAVPKPTKKPAPPGPKRAKVKTSLEKSVGLDTGLYGKGVKVRDGAIKDFEKRYGVKVPKGAKGKTPANFTQLDSDNIVSGKRKRKPKVRS